MSGRSASSSHSLENVDDPLESYSHSPSPSLFINIPVLEKEDVPPKCYFNDDEKRTRKAPFVTNTALTSTASSIINKSDERIIINWEDNDPEKPHNWTTRKKIGVLSIGMAVVLNSTIGSSLPSNATAQIDADFHVSGSAGRILPISMYLVGYIFGPIVFAPLSETYGRRRIMQYTFVLFTIFIMATALSPNWAAFLLFRMFTGIAASSPIAVIGGVYADIYDDPVARGRTMAVFISGTCVGPLTAPIISGFITPERGWRWSFWIALVIAGATLIPIYLFPETYAPTILEERARKMRKATGNPNIIAVHELEKRDFKEMATRILTRPLRMLCSELIVMSSCMYTSLAYAIFYMSFDVYPLVFQGVYKQSAGDSALMFLPIAVGGLFALFIFLWWDSVLLKAQKLDKPWTHQEESRRLPLAFIGGPLYVIALFWIGWTANKDIPYWVPMLSGIPFGMGYMLIFMALLNYLTDSYEEYAASANAASSFCRSIAGATLPFATTSMYRNLGIAWGSTLLGFLSLLMCAIPFVFFWKGDVIRANSKFCIFLKEKKEADLEDARLRREARLRANGPRAFQNEGLTRDIEKLEN
ncbi:hypothetical protein B7463_g4428, partial [Scytalidium lignicola]